MTWLSTLSGRKIDLLNPDPEQIVIEDIAAGLAAMPRWAGQTQLGGAPVVYSVAQHSAFCSHECPEFALSALLHDATEAYMGDCPRPLKDLLAGAWSAIEARLLAAIYRRFGLPHAGVPVAVKAVDDRMLMTERRDLQPHCPPWDWPGPEPFAWRITRAWSADAARDVFLRRFGRLSGQ